MDRLIIKLRKSALRLLLTNLNAEYILQDARSCLLNVVLMFTEFCHDVMYLFDVSILIFLF